jgi:glycosyltransferase involved in cell wall biosynthesis
LGLPLKVIGAGRDLDRLKGMAASNVEFLGYVDKAEVKRYLARCRALLFPGEEDFGITAVEAQAAGRPVIAYAAGGALESVIDGVTGVFFDKQTPEAVVEAVKAFRPETFDGRVIRQHAEKFSRASFEQKIKEFVDQKLRDRGR